MVGVAVGSGVVGRIEVGIGVSVGLEVWPKSALTSTVPI